MSNAAFEHDFFRYLDNWLDDDSVESIEPLPDSVSEEDCQAGAERLLVDGLLIDYSRRDERREAQRLDHAIQAMTALGEKTDQSRIRSKRRFRPRVWVAGATAVAIAVCFVIVAMLDDPNPVNAATMLRRMIAASDEAPDRTYTIRVVEEYSATELARKGRLRGRRTKETLEGAVLHVRGSDHFVFVRSLADGRKRVSGSDGRRSWAFKGKGPVHVSSDPNRFRGGLPGDQHDLPFINIRTQLQQLLSGYEVQLLSTPRMGTGGKRLRGLEGVKRSRELGGPRYVEIWFHPESGMIHSMLLERLPRGRGGPKSVLLELSEVRDLGPSFFSHMAHHEPDRPVRHEDKAR